MNQSQTALMTDDEFVKWLMFQAGGHAAERVRALLARLDQAEADARRYRWWRECWISGGLDVTRIEKDVDEAIDQQRSGK